MLYLEFISTSAVNFISELPTYCLAFQITCDSIRKTFMVIINITKTSPPMGSDLRANLHD